MCSKQNRNRCVDTAKTMTTERAFEKGLDDTLQAFETVVATCIHIGRLLRQDGWGCLKHGKRGLSISRPRVHMCGQRPSGLSTTKQMPLLNSGNAIDGECWPRIRHSAFNGSGCSNDYARTDTHLAYIQPKNQQRQQKTRKEKSPSTSTDLCCG